MLCVFVGFEKPSAIQQRAIVPLIKGRDLIAQSQSGTGKTAVFSIGTLQSLDLSTTETQALSASGHVRPRLIVSLPAPPPSTAACCCVFVA